MKNTKN